MTAAVVYADINPWPDDSVPTHRRIKKESDGRQPERLVDLLGIRAPGSWHGDAACQDHDPDLWTAHDGAWSAAARAICQACPVRLDCLWEAMQLESEGNSSRQGLFGGLSARQREKLSKGELGYNPFDAPEWSTHGR